MVEFDLSRAYYCIYLTVHSKNDEGAIVVNDDYHFILCKNPENEFLFTFLQVDQTTEPSKESGVPNILNLSKRFALNPIIATKEETSGYMDNIDMRTKFLYIRECDEIYLNVKNMLSLLTKQDITTELHLKKVFITTLMIEP